MKSIIATFLVCLVLGWFVPSALANKLRERRRRARIDEQALLNAIASVESGNNPSVIGRAGERGRCQFLRRTWYAYTDAAFESWAGVDCKLTRDVELARLRYIIRALEASGTIPVPRLIASAWRHGVAATGRFTREQYALRVETLYYEFSADRGAMKESPMTGNARP